MTNLGYVLVETCHDHGKARTQVFDIHIDDDLDRVRERAADRQAPLASYGRPDDFFQVCALVEVGAGEDTWQAVLHDNYGNVWTVEDAVESHDSERGFDFAMEVSIARGTAAPVDGRMPGTTDPGDTLCNWDEFDGENDDELTVFRRRWAQAQAMAAGLNAAEATR